MDAHFIGSKSEKSLQWSTRFLNFCKIRFRERPLQATFFLGEKGQGWVSSDAREEMLIKSPAAGSVSDLLWSHHRSRTKHVLVSHWGSIHQHGWNPNQAKPNSLSDLTLPESSEAWADANHKRKRILSSRKSQRLWLWGHGEFQRSFKFSRVLELGFLFPPFIWKGRRDKYRHTPL